MRKELLIITGIMERKFILFIVAGIFIGHMLAQFIFMYENRLTSEQKEVIEYLKRSQEMV